jgi:6-phosphofructokinase 1
MALHLIDHGEPGQMVSLQRGTYASVPIETIGQGLKRVDVDELYDSKAYRPLVRRVVGMPMFLY